MAPRNVGVMSMSYWVMKVSIGLVLLGQVALLTMVWTYYNSHDCFGVEVEMDVDVSKMDNPIYNHANQSKSKVHSMDPTPIHNHSNQSHLPPDKDDNNNTNKKDDNYQPRTLHVIQCVFGDNRYFLDEWEVSFKSILMNAPLDSALHVHIFENDAVAVRTRLQATNLTGTRWRNALSVTVTHVTEAQILRLQSFLEQRLLPQPQTHHNPTNDTNSTSSSSSSSQWMDERLGMGAFFRLFALTYVTEYVDVNTHTPQQRNDLRQVTYLDVDVVVIANLNDFQTMVDQLQRIYQLKALLERDEEEDDDHHRNDKYPLWMWGDHNSGVLIGNALNFRHDFWEAVDQCEAIRQDPWPKKNDQWLLKHVHNCFEELQFPQPEQSPWSIHMGHGYRANPQKLKQQKQQQQPQQQQKQQRGGGAGLLHLQNNGFRNWFYLKENDPVNNDKDHNTNNHTHTHTTIHAVDKFCHAGKHCETLEDLTDVRATWGLAEYYVTISWEWAIYQAATSRIPPGHKGHVIQLTFRHGDGSHNKNNNNTNHTNNHTEDFFFSNQHEVR